MGGGVPSITLPPILGSEPDPEGRGFQNTRPKITCEELSGPWKFRAGLSNESKVMALFRSDRHQDTQKDRHTDGQTKTNHLTTTT